MRPEDWLHDSSFSITFLGDSKAYRGNLISDSGSWGSKEKNPLAFGGNMNGTNRANIRPGTRVAIVQKQDQRSGKRTEGVVRDLLTKSPTHPHGIKVRLENGLVGRVKEIIT